MSNEHVHPAFQGALAAAMPTPITDAFAIYLLALTGNRPRELRASNSPGALQDRICHIEAHVLAFADFMEREIEDTAQHCHLTRREADYAKGVLIDLAGDLRGAFIKAMDGIAA